MKKITFICTCLFVFTILYTENVLAAKPIVNYRVNKYAGGITGWINRYDLVDYYTWIDENGIKNVELICAMPGSSHCKRYSSIVYNNPYTGDQLDDGICDMIDNDCNDMIEYSEQQFVDNGVDEGSSSKTTAVSENGIILYYIVVTCNWNYEFVDEDEEQFDGNVQITASMLLPEEL